MIQRRVGPREAARNETGAKEGSLSEVCKLVAVLVPAFFAFLLFCLREKLLGEWSRPKAETRVDEESKRRERSPRGLREEESIVGVKDGEVD